MMPVKMGLKILLTTFLKDPFWSHTEPSEGPLEN